MLVINFTILLILVTVLFINVYKERIILGWHRLIIKSSLQLRFIFFLTIETIVFFRVFWSYFYFPIVDSWPPIGITKCDYLSLPLLNTVLLLRSAISLTGFHSDVRLRYLLIITIILGAIFMVIQYIEYSTHLSFRLSDGIYGRVFYTLTGFHGSHVFVGLVILTISLTMGRVLVLSYSFVILLSIWYWHFVDVIWVFLFIFIYAY